MHSTGSIMKQEREDGPVALLRPMTAACAGSVMAMTSGCDGPPASVLCFASSGAADLPDLLADNPHLAGLHS